MHSTSSKHFKNARKRVRLFEDSLQCVSNTDYAESIQINTLSSSLKYEESLPSISDNESLYKSNESDLLSAEASNSFLEAITKAHPFCDTNVETNYATTVTDSTIMSNVDENMSLNVQLSEWALTHNVPHNAVNDLLKILKPHFSFLPLDARTLLGTPRNIDIRKVEPGEYYHFGLKNSIEKLLEHSKVCQMSNPVEICLNVDGLPISKSSGSQLYPILVNLFDNKKHVEVVGIYHGNEKPLSANDFLTEFVSEAKDLINNGLIFREKLYFIRIKCFILDVPAKSYITYTKGHSGYMSCSKCYTEGDYISNRVCFPSTKNIQLRTDCEFRQRVQEEHHLGTSLLEQIPQLDMVKSFPLDYMHLICLGVMKKLIASLWCSGKPSAKLSYREIAHISISLLNLAPNIPLEFSRKPRSLNECKRWKATEFRQFLFYTGPLVLKNILSTDKYINFLTLHVATIILASPKHSELLEYAQSLMIYFVDTFISLYGQENVSHNVHNLLHISEDVRIFGNLDDFSAFPFENYMKNLKKMIRKNDRPLQQIIMRKSECSILNVNPVTSVYPQAYKQHVKGPIILDHVLLTQYEKIVLQNFTLTNKNPDNCCKIDNTIIKIENFAQTERGLIVIGKEFMHKTDFYKKPCNSSELGIFVVNHLCSSIKFWFINKIHIQKCVILPFEGEHVVFPFLHE